MKKPKINKYWYLPLALVALNLLVWTGVFGKSAPGFLNLAVFDVGQGDAIYLRTPEGNDVLVDGGPGDAVLAKLGEAMPFADRKLELMILTHPHADHASGLVEILKRYEVGILILPDAVYDSATYEAFLRLAQDKAIQIVRPRLGQRILLDRQTVLDVLFPVAEKFAKQPEDINDVSVVARLSLGTQNILLTGDAGKDIESFLMRAGVPLSAEILKIGHHGSRHSSDLKFIQAVQPQFSAISSGQDNRYGHPHPEVLSALEQAGVPTLRTDQQGDIKFRIFPDKVELQGN